MEPMEPIQEIKFSLLDDGISMGYQEEPLLAYPILRQNPADSMFYLAYTLICYDATRKPEYVDSDAFLDCWRSDMQTVPSGWYHFTNKEGMEVFVDNATGHGHIKAFDNVGDGLDWIEDIRRKECRLHSDIVDRGYTAFSYPGFDGRDADGTISTCTIPATSFEIDELCRNHGWMMNATAEQRNKLFIANECGWPIEHIATMIMMCNDSTTDRPDPGYAMEQKQILGVLTQYNEYHQYELDCIDRRLENEKKLDLDIQPGEEQTYYHHDSDINEPINGPINGSPGQKPRR